MAGEFIGRKTMGLDSPQALSFASQWLPSWGDTTYGPAAGEGAVPGYWDIGAGGKPTYKQQPYWDEHMAYNPVPFAGGGEGGPYQDLSALVGESINRGGLTGSQLAQILNQNMGPRANAAANPDGTISYDAYNWEDSDPGGDLIMKALQAGVGYFSGGFGLNELLNAGQGINSGAFQDAAGNLYNPSASSLGAAAPPAGAGVPNYTEGLLTDPNTGRLFLPPTSPGGAPTLVPEGALIDPATKLPILPGPNGQPIFPGQQGYPSLPGLPTGSVGAPAGRGGAQPQQPQEGKPQPGATQPVPGTGQISPQARQAMNVGNQVGGLPTRVPGVPQAPVTPSAPGAAGMAGAAAAGVGAAGQKSFVDSILDQLKKNLIPLGLGAAGLMASKGNQSELPNRDLLNSLGRGTAETAQRLMQQAQSGQLSGPQQAAVDQATQNAKNQINQYFSSIGQANSTSHMQALKQVDDQALAMRQQYLDTALQQGLQAAGVAQGPLQTIAQYQIGQDRQLQDAFANFASGLGSMFGSKAGTVPDSRNPTVQTGR